MKTYKREAATGLLLFIVVMGAVAVWSPAALEVLKVLSPPVFLFAGAAFGLDAWAKQIKGA